MLRRVANIFSFSFRLIPPLPPAFSPPFCRLPMLTVPRTKAKTSAPDSGSRDTQPSSRSLHPTQTALPTKAAVTKRRSPPLPRRTLVHHARQTTLTSATTPRRARLPSTRPRTKANSKRPSMRPQRPLRMPRRRSRTKCPSSRPNTRRSRRTRMTLSPRPQPQSSSTSRWCSPP